MSEIAVITSNQSGGTEAFELAQRQAKAMASSDLIPEAHRGNVANCLLALNMSNRIGCDPMAVLQNLHVIYGKPGLSTAFLISCFNETGRFTAIRYEEEGSLEDDSLRVRAVCRERTEHADLIKGPWVSMEMARLEGWTTKKGSKWKTMPDLMLRFRAAAFMIRTTAPEISMGLHSAEEVRDIGERIVDQTSARNAQAALEAAHAGQSMGRVAETHDDRGGFEPAEEPELEIDPETGEVIPNDIGQEEIDVEFVEGK